MGYWDYTKSINIKLLLFEILLVYCVPSIVVRNIQNNSLLDKQNGWTKKWGQVTDKKPTGEGQTKNQIALHSKVKQGKVK